MKAKHQQSFKGWINSQTNNYKLWTLELLTRYVVRLQYWLILTDECLLTDWFGFMLMLVKIITVAVIEICVTSRYVCSSWRDIWHSKFSQTLQWRHAWKSFHFDQRRLALSLDKQELTDVIVNYCEIKSILMYQWASSWPRFKTTILFNLSRLLSHDLSCFPRRGITKGM